MWPPSKYADRATGRTPLAPVSRCVVGHSWGRHDPVSPQKRRHEAKLPSAPGPECARSGHCHRVGIRTFLKTVRREIVIGRRTETMITAWGGQTSRSIRAVWVLEEMGLPYRVRQVDMLAAEKDAAWLAVNPGDFLPAIQDGDVTMVESVAIMEYLMGRNGPTPLQPSPDDAAFASNQQL